MAETTSPPVALSATWHSWWVTPCTLSSTCRGQSLLGSYPNLLPLLDNRPLQGNLTSITLLCNSESGKRPPEWTVALLAPGVPMG